MNSLILFIVSFWGFNSFGVILPDGNSTKTRKMWTYLVYVAGDEEEADPSSRMLLRRLEQVGSDDKRWLIAQADFYLDDQGKKLVSEPSRRYVIGQHLGEMNVKDYASLKPRSPEVWNSISEIDSSATRNLEEFLRWGTENYPAEHYALIVVGHSWGWRGIAQDFNVGHPLPVHPSLKINYVMASLSEFSLHVGRGMKGQKLDLLVLDACNDGVLEIAHEVQGLTKVFVAAPTESPAHGFDYVRSLRRNLYDSREFAQYLVSDALESFARGGSQTSIEGNHEAISYLAIDTEKMVQFWSDWREVISSLRDSNFSELFLGKQESKWINGDRNIDLYELLQETVKESDSSYARSRAQQLVEGTWGLANFQTLDQRLLDLPAPRGSWIQLRIDADELVSEKECLEKARSVFNFLNPALRVRKQQWRVETQLSGTSKKRRFITIRFKQSRNATGVSVRPFLPGTTTVDIEITEKSSLKHLYTYTQDQTYSYIRDFPTDSPYLIVGHTTGAGRYNGLGVNLDSEMNVSEESNNHFSNGRWLSGREYYQSLAFSQLTGWAELLFSWLE